MSDHDLLNELLPLYAAGQLDEPRRRRVAAHLADCPECQADLELWRSVSVAIRAADQRLEAPTGLAQKTLQRVRQPRRPNLLLRAWQMLRAQARLVQGELWPASAAIIAIGYFLAVMADNAGVIRALSPMVASACIAVIFRSENDPAVELELACPTSPRQILLARLALVFGYNFLLSLAASLALLPVLPALKVGPLDVLVLGWLGPMAFLSSAALLLSLLIGASNALTVAYLAWLLQFVNQGLVRTNLHVQAEINTALAWYQQLWQQPVVLVGLSLVLLVGALFLAGRSERSLPRLV